ncbi:U3 small nucleolar RNA-associated protein 25 homolog [Tachysurus fulvidraco]|uniref:U3 small nucleolar RNA-associated protein 25 homolog n=1 Tax=Tachysurus fulvidraco TaxID=1234273 RepID=UPI001FEF3345|nr:U3 small nucleolar RNA-associated protein 25 homolog [Tachysurus fulvidraco]
MKMGKRRRKNPNFENLSQKQKKHLKEFGERHPFDDQVTERAENTQIVRLKEKCTSLASESDGEEEEEKPSAYDKLLLSINRTVGEEEESEEEDGDDAADDLDKASEVDDEEAEERGGDGDDDDGDEEAAGLSEEEDAVGGKQEAQGGEFTDETREAEFSLESNLPADGEQEKHQEHHEGQEDMYVEHQETELSEFEVNRISNGSKLRTQIKWSRLGVLHCSCPLERFPAVAPSSSVSLPPFHKTLEPKVRSLVGSGLSALQDELLRLMGSYRDVYYPECSVLDGVAETRQVFCLHALNHVLKANSRVLTHNAVLKQAKAGDEDELRDQGLTRPKVLIMVPFRDGALRIIQTFISLLESDGKKMDVSNKKRFKDEYGEEPNSKPAGLHRPDDHHAIFSGNVDDHFRIGVSILKRSMRLYSPFYSSDIIIASPLGLRTLIGVEGEAQRDFDFLSSVELLVLEQSDVFLMQNWEHVLHVMKHMNLQPLDSHGVDFSRVRMWNLNNWARFYRQTLVFSSIQEPQINNIITKHCHNYRGQVSIKNLPKTGSISQVLVQLPHVFQMFHTDSFMDQDERFRFFVNKVLPQYRDSVMSHTLIYVPSYFDFVRVRNFLKKEDVSFCVISEYSERAEVSRARHFFSKGEKQFLLFSERFHFYKRSTIRGIQNIIFYALPTYAHFYSEVCNMLQVGGSDGSSSFTCTTLYSRYDAHRLAAIGGAERAASMIRSNKSVHLFITGEEVRV